MHHFCLQEEGQPAQLSQEEEGLMGGLFQNCMIHLNQEEKMGI
jgi:hypothetical protein